MALLVEKGTWTGNGSSPQTITLANGSLTPIAIICWATGPGAAGTITANSIFSLGFGTRRGGATQQGCLSLWVADNVATSSASRNDGTTLLRVLSAETTADYNVSLSSFGAGQFTVTYSSAANANGDNFHYIVIGGADATDAIVVLPQLVQGTPPFTQDVTTVGFQGNVLFALWGSSANAGGTPTSNSVYSFGVAAQHDAGIGQWSIGGHFEDAITMATQLDADKRFSDSDLITGLAATGQAMDAVWALDSFLSNGFRLACSDSPGTNNTNSVFLVIQGGQWNAFSQAKDTATGTDDYPFSSPSFTPAAALFANAGNVTTADSLISNMNMCVGATDGTRQGIAGYACVDRVINTQADRLHATDRCIEVLSGGNPMTEGSEASFSAFSAGNVQINWATNNGAADLMGVLAMGDTAAAPTGHPTMRRFSETKYNRPVEVGRSGVKVA